MNLPSKPRLVRPLPRGLRVALRRLGARPGRYVLIVSVQGQSMSLWEEAGQAGPAGLSDQRPYLLRRRYRVSTSAFGVGQRLHSNRTPLGLHRVAVKIGGGAPPGTVFRFRQAIGFTWRGLPTAKIVHRILWLEGLEPGFNRGGQVDSFRRCIYIHGFGDEKTLGRPTSHGCIHLAAQDLIPLFDLVPVGTLVWIAER